jgi:hypothetical protein
MKKTIVLFIMFAAVICASISVNADTSLTRVWSQTGTANLPAGTNYYDQIDNKNISCTFLNKSGTKHFYIQDHTGSKVYDWVVNDNAASGTNHVTTTANYTSFSTSRAVTSDETGNLIFTNSYTTSSITAFKILAADAYTAHIHHNRCHCRSWHKQSFLLLYWQSIRQCAQQHWKHILCGSKQGIHYRRNQLRLWLAKHLLL